MLIVLQDLNSVHNSADEMEMYAAVNRKFHAIFNRQEIMKTFKTYDRLEVRLINIPQRKHEFDTGRFFKKITEKLLLSLISTPQVVYHLLIRQNL